MIPLTKLRASGRNGVFDWGISMTKQFKSVVLCGVACAGLFALSATSFAVPMKAVYTGTVGTSYDQTNLFGQGTGSNVLNGQAFTLTYLYDPDTVGAYQYGSPVESQVYGGTAYGVPSPMQSATLTISGLSQTMGGNYFGRVDQGNAGSAYSYHYAVDFSDNGVLQNYDFVQTYAYGPAAAIPVDLNAPYFLATLFTQYGYFYFTNYDYALGAYTTNTQGTLNFATLTVSPVSAVPLPAALPLFAAGLGGLGIIARRRKAKLAA
jgi:hypothetical protein